MNEQPNLCPNCGFDLRHAPPGGTISMNGMRTASDSLLGSDTASVSFTTNSTGTALADPYALSFEARIVAELDVNGWHSTVINGDRVRPLGVFGRDQEDDLALDAAEVLSDLLKKRKKDH